MEYALSALFGEFSMHFLGGLIPQLSYNIHHGLPLQIIPHNSSQGLLNVAVTVLSWSMTLKDYPGPTRRPPPWARPPQHLGHV